MATKQIIADLNKGNKFDGDNYNVWHRKIPMVLEEQEVEDTLLATLTQPQGEDANDTEKVAAYENWRKKDKLARITLLSSMDNEFIFEYEECKTAFAMWEALKAKYGGTSLTRLRGLTIRFDSYKKEPQHSMKKHLRIMANMIRELKSAGSELSDEQQISAVVHSLPIEWEHMQVDMTHNANITTFEHIRSHLELEAEHLKAIEKPVVAYAIQSSSRR